MSNTLQYLDYEGLKYYDRKLKAQLSSLIPENGKDGQDGQDGEDGLTPEFRIQDDKLQYRYLGQDDDAWVDLGNVKGADGTIGADGTSVTITSTEDVKDEADNVIGIKVTFSDGKEITINHGKDGADGADGDLSDAYEEGSDIVISDTDSDNIKNISVGLSKDFTVVKGLGQYTQGQTIPKGTTLYQIVEKLLGGKLLATITKQPEATYSQKTDETKNYEVGTNVNASITITVDNKGSYTTYNGTTASTSTTTHTATETPASFKGSITSTQTLKATCTIDSKTVTATNSDGSTNSLTISQTGAKESKVLTLKPRMKMFIYKGELTIVANGEINRSILTEQELVKAGTSTPIKYTNSKGLLNNRYVYFFVPATGALTESCASGKKWALIADTSNTNGPKDKSGAPILGFEKLTTDGTADGAPVIVKIKDAYVDPEDSTKKSLRDYHVYRFKTGELEGLGDATEVNLQFDYVSSTDSEPAMKYFKI